MELRDIEVLLTLAEELHFGRTAERLHVTQARVSQVVKAQERRIGTVLFERDSRNVRLTPIGKQLVEDLRPIKQSLHSSIERAASAAREKTDVLRLGMIGINAEELDPHREAFHAGHPHADVRIRQIGFADPFGPLRRGEIDLALLWLPVDEPDLTVGPVLYSESVVLAVAAGNPLADRESVSYEDLADQVVMGGASPGYWREALVPTHTPSGRAIKIGPTATNWAEMFPILVTGEAVSPVHAHSIRYSPGISFVPIDDAPPARWALVWRTDAATDLIRAFARTARDTR
ncbi:LysR family transcriptional regulator [Amycolatopsis sp. lyj-108]|uniref:LysR family transcriptional regulator n=1 Tax=Amycolatopsis sp. lyj-108 TaxID=2789286 RepID=UPI00397D7C7B